MFGLIDSVFGFVAKIFGFISSDDIAKINANATVDVASTQAMGAVEQRWWFVSLMIPLFALPFVAYTWKAVFWDNVVDSTWGANASTPALNGNLGVVFTTVIIGIFLHAVTR